MYIFIQYIISLIVNYIRLTMGRIPCKKKKYSEENCTFDGPVDFVAPPLQLLSYFLVNAILHIDKPLMSWTEFQSKGGVKGAAATASLEGTSLTEDQRILQGLF